VISALDEAATAKQLATNIKLAILSDIKGQEQVGAAYVVERDLERRHWVDSAAARRDRGGLPTGDASLKTS
jgi:hypothetical protein